MPNLTMLLKTDGVIEAQLIGIRKASTFTGFCAKHDKQLFAEIEDQEFVASPKQVFLHGYRAVAMELYKKTASTELSEGMGDLDQGRDPLPQVMVQMLAGGMAEGNALGRRDMQERKDDFVRVWDTEAWGELNYVVIEFDSELTISSGGVFTPEADFAGARLQQWGDGGPAPDYLCFSLIPTPLGGAAIWCWLGDLPASAAFAKSLLALSDDDIASAIVQFAFESIENTYGSPVWWEGLAKETQDVLLARMREDPMDEKPLTVLIPDGRLYANWRVKSRQSSFAKP